MSHGFGFEFVINFSMDIFQIKPPMSFGQLVEITKERYDLKQINEFYLDEEEITIANDSDYLKLLDWADNSGMKEIELIIKSKDKKKGRKQSLRKISSSFKPISGGEINEIRGYDEGTCNGNFFKFFNLIFFPKF